MQPGVCASSARSLAGQCSGCSGGEAGAPPGPRVMVHRTCQAPPPDQGCGPYRGWQRQAQACGGGAQAPGAARE